MRARSPAAILAALALALVAARLGVAASVRGTFFDTGQQVYDEVAENLLHGRGLTIGGAPWIENPPLYPLAVVSAYAIGGHGWWSVAVMQALFDVGSLVLLYLLARRLFGQTAALLAAAMFALYPYLAGQAALLMDTSLFVLALLAFLYLAVRVADTGSRRDAVLMGLAAGAAYLVRPTVLAILLVTPALLALLGQRRGPLWRSLGIAAAAAALLVTPWVVRNAIEFHAFVPGSAKFGENFYAGNSPHAAEYISSGRSTDLVLQLPDAPKPPARYDQVQRDNWWLRRGLEWVRDNPGDWLHGLRVKLEAYWSWDLNPETTGDSRLKKALYTATYLPLLVLALVALARAVRPGRRRELAFLALIIGVFTLIHVLVVAYTRVRAPLDPLLMALAGWLLADAFRWAFARRSSTGLRAEGGRASAPSA